MKAVFDANVLVAALISRTGTCAAVYRESVIRKSVVVSEFILAEVVRVLRDKFKVSSEILTQDVEAIRATAEVVVPLLPPRDACRDPNDLPVIGTATAANADVIVTGDADLLDLRRFLKIRILRPAEYLRELDTTPAPADYDEPGDPPVGLTAAERSLRYGRRRKKKR